MDEPFAENLYLFRHQVLRDGMYQLLPPSERARLHLLALSSFGPADDSLPSARALAFHAAGALIDGHQLSDSQVAAVRAAYLGHLRRWAGLANAAFQHLEEAQAWRGITRHPDTGAEEAADAHLKAAAALSSAGSYRTAIHELDECRAMLAGLDFPRLHAKERLLRGRTLAILGEAANAEEATREAVSAAESLGDSDMFADALSALGAVYERQGRLDEALELFQRAISLLGSSTELVPRTLLRVGYASALREAGRNKEALEQARIAYESLQVADHPRLYIHALVRYGTCLSDNGAEDAAEALYWKALPIAREYGVKLGYGACLGNLANIFSKGNRDLRRAEELHLESLQINREAGALSSEALSLNNLASIWFNAGRLTAAGAGFREARAKAVRASYRLLEARAACTEGRVLLLLGRYREGREAILHGVECLQGSDRGRFLLEFGEMDMLRAELARPECSDGLRLARETLERMRSIAGKGDHTAGHLQEAEAVVNELERASQDGHVPVLAAGHHPDFLTSGQCAALLDILVDCASHSLLEALAARAGSEPTPAWGDSPPAVLAVE